MSKTKEAEFTLKDGRTIVFDVPIDYTPAQAQAAAEQYIATNPDEIAAPSQPKTVKAPSGFKRGLRDPVDAGAQFLERALPQAVVDPMNRFNNFLAEKGFPVARVPEGGVDQLVRDEEAKYQAQRQAAGEKGIDWGRIGGNIANPVNLAVASKIPAGFTLLGKLGMGATAGGTLGALQPVTSSAPEDYWNEKTIQTLMGGALGAGTAAATQAASWAWRQIAATKAMTNPEGRLRIVKEAIRRWAGNDADDIIKSIDNTSPSPLGPNGPKRLDALPDSPVTTADAIAEGNIKAANSADPRMFGRQIVSAQESLARSSDVDNKLVSAAVKQQTARERAIGEIAKTEAERKAAVAMREKATRPLYEAAKKSKGQVQVDDVEAYLRTTIDDNINNSQIAEPLTRILKNISREKKQGGNVKNLISLRDEVRNMLQTKTPGGQNQYDAAVLDKTKTLLEQAIIKAEPRYGEALRLYRDLSGPINRMDVGTELMNRMRTPTNVESGSAFLSAGKDAARTIKRATGFNRYDKLDDVLTPLEMDKYNKVARELEREAKKSILLSRGRPHNAAREAEEGMVELPRLLEQNLVIANYFLGRAKEQIIPEMNQMAADILLDPQKFKAVLAHVPKNKTAEFIKNLQAQAKLERAVVPAFSSMNEEGER